MDSMIALLAVFAMFAAPVTTPFLVDGINDMRRERRKIRRNKGRPVSRKELNILMAKSFIDNKESGIYIFCHLIFSITITIIMACFLELVAISLVEVTQLFDGQFYVADRPMEENVRNILSALLTIEAVGLFVYAAYECVKLSRIAKAFKDLSEAQPAYRTA